MNKLKSVMSSQFSRVPAPNIMRSKFDRSHGIKTTFDAGYLVPFYIDEVYPGDTFNLSASLFGRLSTPLVAPMDNLKIETFFFAVPNRLVWSNWQRFMGERDPDPDTTIDLYVPILDKTKAPLSTTGFVFNSLYDHLGLPTGVIALDNVSSLWCRAYNLIWNEWFRDQNMLDSVDVNKTSDGPDDPADYVLLKRGKRHDYFTSCLPWAQKGSSVDLPLGTTAPVIRNDADPDIYFYDGSTDRRLQAKNTTKEVEMSNTWGTNNALKFGGDTETGKTGLITDLTNATAATINALRQAFQIQKMLEKDARAGTRYREQILGHFGVYTDDARLQRPEYLGGGSSYINISPVPQTSASGATPQGHVASIGTLSAHGHGFVKSFNEHCILIGMACVTADLTYQQGLNRMFSRSTRYDYYFPSFANLGEQAVLNKEIFCDASSNDEDPFGYQERYAELRYKPSEIHGAFRSTYASSIDIWHFSQEFANLPVLDDPDFIEENPPLARNLAAGPHILLDAYINLKCVRPMPVNSIPGYIDHF